MKIYSLEGIDGVGKTTVANSLIKFFSSRGVKACFVDRKKFSFRSQSIERRLIYSLIWGMARSVLPESTKVRLMCRWYHLLLREIRRTHYDKCIELFIIDGWVHRPLIKTKLLTHVDGDDLFFRAHKYFPEMHLASIILITANPHLAIGRINARSCNTSDSILDQFESSVEKLNCLQLELKKLSKQFGWYQVGISADDSIQEVTQKISSIISEKEGFSIVG